MSRDALFPLIRGRTLRSLLGKDDEKEYKELIQRLSKLSNQIDKHSSLDGERNKSIIQQMNNLIKEYDQ